MISGGRRFFSAALQISERTFPAPTLASWSLSPRSTSEVSLPKASSSDVKRAASSIPASSTMTRSAARGFFLFRENPPAFHSSILWIVVPSSAPILSSIPLSDTYGSFLIFSRALFKASVILADAFPVGAASIIRSSGKSA